MFTHIMIGSNDIAKSRAFYDALFGAIGGKPGTDAAKGRVMYVHKGGRLVLTKPLDGNPAHGANGGTIGFMAESPADVDAWHVAGISHGGAICEDPPGMRQGGIGPVYVAYLRDPDGNKICAVHPMAS